MAKYTLVTSFYPFLLASLHGGHKKCWPGYGRDGGLEKKMGRGPLPLPSPPLFCGFCLIFCPLMFIRTERKQMQE